MSAQYDEVPPEREESEEEKATSTAPSGYQTPVEEDIDKTGQAAQTDAKPTAEQESGSSDPLVKRAGNQGTEKR
jgi:photosystem I subunit 4